MEFKKINEDKFQCLLYEEDLEYNNITLDDFFRNDTEKIHNLLEVIMDEAHKNIGVELGGGVMSLQLAPQPDHSILLTVSSGKEDFGNMLKQAGETGAINFTGNIEARDVPLGGADVVVADGFSGNILLKGIEGTALFMASMMKNMFKKNVLTKLAALLCMDGVKAFKKKMDYRETGGTLTQIADIAFIGKSLPPNDGGQTPIDCAAIGVPMVYGPNMSNFRRICATLEESAAAIKVKDAESAIAEIERLAKNPELRKTLAESAKKWHSSNIGAARRDFEAIEKFL